MTDQTTAYFMREISHWKSRALKAEQPKQCPDCVRRHSAQLQKAASRVRVLAVANHELKKEVEQLASCIQKLETGSLYDQLSQAESRIFVLESVIAEQQSVVDQLLNKEEAKC